MAGIITKRAAKFLVLIFFILTKSATLKSINAAFQPINAGLSSIPPPLPPQTLAPLPPQTLAHLPPQLKAQLNSRYPGFRVPQKGEFAANMMEALSNSPGFSHPSNIKGDWNGDGLEDMALLLIKEEKEVHLATVACHKNNNGSYKLIELEHILLPKVIGAKKRLEYLRVMLPVKRKIYDSTKEKVVSLKLKHPAIERGTFEKSSTLHYWNGKKYEYIIFAD